MSDALKGNIPGLENDQVPGTEFVVTVEGTIAVDGKETSITGALHSVLFDIDPEIEFRVLLHDAFDVIEGENLTFKRIMIQQQHREVALGGPFTVKAARVSAIDADNDPDTQMCVLALSLKRVKK